MSVWMCVCMVPCDGLVRVVNSPALCPVFYVSIHTPQDLICLPELEWIETHPDWPRGLSEHQHENSDSFSSRLLYSTQSCKLFSYRTVKSQSGMAWFLEKSGNWRVCLKEWPPVQKGCWSSITSWKFKWAATTNNSVSFHWRFLSCPMLYITGI